VHDTASFKTLESCAERLLRLPPSVPLCPAQDFSVYVANDPSKLADEFGRRATAWCGLRHTLSWDSRTCVTRISPFQEVAVAVVKPSYKSGARRETRTGRFCYYLKKTFVFSGKTRLMSRSAIKTVVDQPSATYFAE